MSCIGQTDARVRSGGAGDALPIVKPSGRGTRVCLADPQGRVFKALGRRPAPLAMRQASRRGTVLAQGLENPVQPVTITRTGS